MINKGFNKAILEYLLAHLAADVTDTAFTIEALDLHVASAQGLCHLTVLLAELFEDELTLESVVILSTPSVLASLT